MFVVMLKRYSVCWAGRIYQPIAYFANRWSLVRVLLVSLAFGGVLPLTGCTTGRMQSSGRLHSLSWSARQSQLQALTHWTAIGVLTAFDGQNAMVGYFNWAQQGLQVYRVSVHGPLGVGGFLISGSPTQVALRQATGRTIVAKTPEQLMHSALGWSLPVSELIYWLRGLPAPQQAHAAYKMTHDASAHLVQLRQQGWVITYEKLTAVGEVDLPERLVLRYQPDADGTSSVWVKLRITRWKL